MKKILKIVLFLFLGLFLFLIAAPFLFKDKIKAMIQEDANELLNASIYFGDVDLSFIKSFPNASISIRDFGLVGAEVFALDTLAQGENFELVVDIMNILSDDPIEIKRILLDNAKIHAIVLEDGRANWDIMKPDSTSADPATEDSSTFQIGLQRYELKNSSIRYEDATIPMDLAIVGMNHEGRGDFTASVYELDTQTEIQSLTAIYDGVSYLKKSKLDADATLKIDVTDVLRIDFLDNEFILNALGLGLDGYFAMPGDDMEMDLSFAAKQTTFKSLLSMVPGIYTADFQDIETDGLLTFDGFVKGIYNDTRMPGFGLNAVVKDAMMKYPDLPKAVTGIQMDLHVNNPNGDLEKTHVLLNQFHADLGQNPIDAKLDMTGLERIALTGDLKAKLNLDELTQMFPVDGTTLRGLFSVDANAEGVYDDAAGQFPTVQAVMDMKDGYVKNAEYPAELSDFHFHGELQDASGELSTAVLDIPDFHLLLDGEPLDGTLHVKNFDNPTYALEAKGRLDLEKLMQVYPIDSMTLTGKLIVEDFSTKGTYSDIEAEQYTRLPTSGKVKVQNLVYSDAYLAAPVTIDQGTLVFSPTRMDISGARGTLGKSDYKVDGYFSNYLAYALMDGQMLTGTMQLRSQTLDVNEWMEEEESSPTSSGAADESNYEVIPIPDNLNVAFQAQIDKVIYEDLVLENMNGGLTVVNETVQMEDLGFNMFGSDVLMSGEYKTQNQREPSYHFFMDLEQLAVNEAVKHFSFIKAFAPALEFVDGVCNTQFGISGLLRSDMMPVLESINSAGLFNMLNGGLKQTPMLASLSEKTKVKGLSSLNLAKAVGKFEIQDGSLIVSPIDLKIGDMMLSIGGNQNLAGNLDYDLVLDAPSGKIDQAAMGALSNLTGTALQTSERLVFNLKVGGTHKKPSISGGSGGTGDQVKSQLTEAAEDKLKEKLGTEVQLDKDSLKQQVAETKAQVKDTVQVLVEETKTQVKDTVQALVDEKKEELKKEAEDKVGEVIGEEAKEQLDQLKDKFGLPKFKRKKKKQ